MTLQTLINTYPDSEFIARRQIGVVGDSLVRRRRHRRTMSQAEIEYKDFETFFPNMPEAAEAQLQDREHPLPADGKPDRDYTHKPSAPKTNIAT